MISDPLALVGTTVAEKYRVDAAVGEGGFAIVYKATHLVWQRPVALKVFRALGEVRADQRDAVMETFIAEGRLLADLSERSAVFVQSRDVATLMTADGQWMPYLVLEWLEGETLEDFLAKRTELASPPTTFAEMMQLLQPIGEGLALAHSRGVAHRDVKPSNIFLVGKGSDRQVKLLDLGIAKVVQDAQADLGAFRKTTGKMTSFTPMYGAPEQFSRSNGPTGPWTDVFALALVMLEVMAGRYALSGEDLTQIAWAACNPIDRPTPRSLGLVVSDDVEAVFAKALAVQTAQRFASVGDFWEALRLAGGIVGGAKLVTYELDGTTNALVARRGDGSNPLVPGGQTTSASSLPSLPMTTSQSPAKATSPVLLGAVGLGAALVVGAGVLLLLARPARPTAAAPTAPSTLPSSMSVASAQGAPSSSGMVADPGTATPCPADMLPIPGGPFFMGSDDSDPTFPARNQPAHKVKLAPYCIDRFEVKTADYLALSNSSTIKRSSGKNNFDGFAGFKDADRATYDALCTSHDPQKLADYPINCVDWNMAQSFCNAKGKRLPTEAEWEFAARGPDQRKYPWGDDPPGPGLLNACGAECVAWGKEHKVSETAMYTTDDGFPNSAPVGSFPKGKSRYGVEDVVGNVWEWTADWFAAYGADSASTTQENPTGPSTGQRRVIRGGAWNGADPSWVKPTLRYHDDPTHSSYGVGFRCAT